MMNDHLQITIDYSIVLGREVARIVKSYYCLIIDRDALIFEFTGMSNLDYHYYDTYCIVRRVYVIVIYAGRKIV